MNDKDKAPKENAEVLLSMQVERKIKLGGASGGSFLKRRWSTDDRIVCIHFLIRSWNVC